ncbi:MAG: HEAT repeat domain-containing protein [Planctomycetota bacterium]
MAPRPHPALLPLACCTLLLCAPPAAAKESWKDLEKAYADARKVVSDAAAGRMPKPKNQKQTAEQLVAEAKRELVLVPEKMLAEDGNKAVKLLLDEAVLSEDPDVATGAMTALRQVKDAKAVKALLKEVEKSKELRLQRLLCAALADVKDRGAASTLQKLTREKDTALVATAVRALGARGEKEAAGPLKRLLKDDSLRVRYATADALERLTNERPKDLPVPQVDAKTGLPDRFACDRVAFLVDATAEAREEAFEDPFAAGDDEQGAEKKDGEKKGDGAEKKDGEKKDDAAEKKDDAKPKPAKKKGKPGEKPKPLSPYGVAARLLKEAVGKLHDPTRYYAARFSSSVEGQGGYRAGGAKAVGELTSWLERGGATGRDRRLDLALADALAQSPPPDEIYVFLVAAPSRRLQADIDATLADARRQLRGAGVAVHVVRLLPAPAQAPRTEGGKQMLQDQEQAFASFANALTTASGGRAAAIDLARLKEPEPEAKPGKQDKELAALDFTKALPRASHKKLKKAVDEALAAPEPTDAQIKLIEDLAACPDREATALALPALTGGDPNLSRAAAAGFAKNPDPKVQLELMKEFRSAKQPAQQIALLRALGPAKGPAIADGLAVAVAILEGDVARVAWRYLADRPAEELKDLKGKLTRKTKGLSGLAQAYANDALAKANGRPLPPRDGLDFSEGLLLPERFLEKGVAFILDSNVYMNSVFWNPPPAAGGEKPKEEPKRGRGKKGKEPEADAPQPVTAHGAASKEIERALKAIEKGGLKANVFQTGGKSWRPGSAEEIKGNVADAARWLQAVHAGNQRDVWKPLQRALQDTAIERVILLVSGPPIRSPGSDGPKELLDKVRELNAGRDVQIDVVYVLPPAPQEPMAQARRRDELKAMDAVYSPLAQANRGKVVIRTTLRTLGAKD